MRPAAPRWMDRLWPGAGQLAEGDPQGFGVASLTLIVLMAGLHWPRLLTRLDTGALHPWMAALAWSLAITMLWGSAWRTQPPRLPRGLCLVLAVGLLAALTPFLAPFAPDAIDTGAALSPPTWAHPLGTDEIRRDVFSRVLYGARVSLGVGLGAVALSTTLGVALGGLAGWLGGAVDAAIRFAIDLLLALPRLVLLMALVGLIRGGTTQSLTLVILVLGGTGWMGLARLVRAEVLTLRGRDHIVAARALGLGPIRLAVVHLLPTLATTVLVQAALAVGATILVEAALSFFGLGAPPPTASWGALIDQGRAYLRTAWWIALAPGVMIGLTTLGFNQLAESARRALEPPG